MKRITFFSSVVIAAMVMASCKKDQQINDADYPEQTIYMPAAVEGNSKSGVYFVDKVAVPGQVYRYTVDAAAKKLRIPLAVYRAGVNTKGAISVNVSANTDTAAKLLAAGKFPAGTEVLSLGKYDLPSPVSIADGADYAPFNFSVEIDFLLANVTKKFAIGVGVSSTERKLGPFHTTILLLDPAFLVPTANFTTSVSGRTVSFSNTSTNGVTYSWNYGDGSAPSTAAAASYTYQAAGTYTVTLTTTGVLGASNASVKTATVTVL